MSAVKKWLRAGSRLGLALAGTVLLSAPVGAAVELPASSDATVAPTLVGEDAIFYFFNAPPGAGDPPDAENLYVFKQALSTPFAGYEESRDVWLSQQDVYAADQDDKTRPAVATDQDDTYVYYVGTNGNVYKLWLNSGAEAEVISSGNVISVAVSPDNRRLAFTTSSAPDRIQVLDQSPDSGTTTSYTIPLVDYDAALDTVQLAKSLAFDYSGTQIVFDAWFCDLPGDGSGTCNSDADGYRDIGILSLVDGLADGERVVYPLPDPAPGVDVGYPRFAYNNNFVLVMDYHYPDPDSGQTVAEIRTFNRQPPQGADPFQLVASLGSTDPAADPLWGVPSFWADEDFVTVQTPVAGDMTIHRVAVDETWAGPGDAALGEQLNPYNAHMPVMHRLAPSDYAIELRADRQSVDFGWLADGDTDILQVTVTNSGDIDTYITAIDVPETIDLSDIEDLVGKSESGFFVSDIDLPLFLPRGESLTVDVSFDADSEFVESGTQIGNLNFSYGDGDLLNVSLIATLGLNTVRADLQADKTAVDFGEFEVNDPIDAANVVLTNTGDPGEEITIFETELDGPFTYDLGDVADIITLNGQETLRIQVAYTPAGEPAEHSGSLTIRYGLTDDLISTLVIPLSATTVAAGDTGGGGGSGDGDGDSPPAVEVSPVNEAGVGALGYLLVLLLARCLWRPSPRRADRGQA